MAIAALFLTGCSLVAVKPPRGAGSDCTVSRTAPVVDFISAGAILLEGTALLEADNRGVWESPGKAAWIGVVTAVTLSGVWGWARTGECRARNRPAEPVVIPPATPAVDPWLSAGPAPGTHPPGDAGTSADVTP
jgi:hypothetical protein